MPILSTPAPAATILAPIRLYPTGSGYSIFGSDAEIAGPILGLPLTYAPGDFAGLVRFDVGELAAVVASLNAAGGDGGVWGREGGMNESLQKAAQRIRGTAKNPHLGLNEWYPVHPGDDAGIVTQRRAYHSDVILVAEFVLSMLAGKPSD